MWEELSAPMQRDQLLRLAWRRRWGLSLLLIGWLHLLAFLICYYMTIVVGYNGAAGYLTVWGTELCGALRWETSENKRDGVCRHARE